MPSQAKSPPGQDNKDNTESGKVAADCKKPYDVASGCIKFFSCGGLYKQQLGGGDRWRLKWRRMLNGC